MNRLIPFDTYVPTPLLENRSVIYEDPDGPCDFFLDFYPEIISIVLGKYCDGKSLSTLLITLLSSKCHRLCGLELIMKTTQSRADHLKNNGWLPPNSNGINRWGSIDFATLITDISIGEGYDAIQTYSSEIALSKIISMIRRISERLAVIHFFEECWDLHPIHPEHIECPLWCGTVTMDCSPDFSGNMVETANVTAMTPINTWDLTLVEEWTKLSGTHDSRKNIKLTPGPRRAMPMPPLARLQACTPKDAIAVSKMAHRLRERDEVAPIGGIPFVYRRQDNSDIPMSGWVMSRKQALTRINGVLQIMTRLQTEMWPLNYECQIDPSMHIHTRKRTSSIENAHDIDSTTDELFAFMDRPHVVRDDQASDDTRVDLTCITQHVTRLMKEYETNSCRNTFRAPLALEKAPPPSNNLATHLPEKSKIE
jgi:hypothetical protein